MPDWKRNSSSWSGPCSARRVRRRWRSSCGMSRRPPTSGRWWKRQRSDLAPYPEALGLRGLLNDMVLKDLGLGNMAIKTVGFIGIGNMGRPMAANLVKGGYQVVAYDADMNRAAQFAKDVGAKAAATLAELGAQVDAIVTMLPTGKEVRAVLLEAEG